MIYLLNMFESHKILLLIIQDIESTWLTWGIPQRRQKAVVDSAFLNGGGNTVQVNEEVLQKNQI